MTGRASALVLLAAASLACTGLLGDGKDDGKDGMGEDRGGPPIDVGGPFDRNKRRDPCESLDPGIYWYEVPFQGRSYRAILVVPKGRGPKDLVVALHGGGGTPQKILMQTRLHEEAMAQGFAVLAPPAANMGDHGAHWNSGKFDGELPADQMRDDVAFLDEAARRARKDVCGRDVLATGFSSGGQMAQRWGCQGTEPVAVLSAAGTLLVDPVSCREGRPVRGYVGTEDKLFEDPPLEGSDQPNAVQSIDRWARLNDCALLPPEPTQTPGTPCREYVGCQASTVLCVVEGYPHGWPAPWNHKGGTTTNATTEGIAWFRRVQQDRGRDR